MRVLILAVLVFSSVLSIAQTTNPAAREAFNRGLADADAGRYEQAVAEYSDALRIDPTYAAAFNNRGNSYLHLSQYQRALQDFDEAIRLNPTYVLAYDSRGYVYQRLGRPERAIQDYDEAIRLNPKYVRAYSGRGSAYQSLGRPERAIQDYEEAIRLNPKLASAYVNRGNAHKDLAQYERAIRDYEQAIRLDPKYANAHNNLAWLMATASDARFRDGKKAIELALKACALSLWKDAGHIDTLAAAYAEAGDFAEAVKWQEKALEFPDFVQAREEKMRQRLQLYRQGKPYYEQSGTAGKV